MEKNEEIEKPVLSPVLPRWWRVLPSMLLMVMITTADGIILNDFIEHRYATRYQTNSSSSSNARELCLNHSDTADQTTASVLTTTAQYSSSTTLSPDDEVQQLNARLQVFMSVSAVIPAILASILLGANCDRTGRKSLIVLPFFGKSLHFAILTATAARDLSDTWIILSVLMDGILGTSGLVLLSSFAYITDCTSKATRTSAIIITEVLMTGCRFIPLFGVGIYLRQPHFIETISFMLGLSVIGLIYSVAIQPESNLKVQHMNVLQQLREIKIREIKKVLQVFLVKREGHKQRSLLMLIFTHLSLVVMISGYSSVSYLYLYGAPFCFDSLGVSLTSVTQTVAMVLLSIPCTLAVTKRTDHLALPILGCFAYLAQLFIVGTAKHGWTIYMALCIGGVFYVLVPIIRSRITKLVEQTEYAVVFILTSIFESGGSFAVSAMANGIYQASLTFQPGLVFFVFAVFGVVAIILMT